MRQNHLWPSSKHCARKCLRASWMVSDGQRSLVVHRETVVFSPCDLAPWVSSLLMIWKGYVDCDRRWVWTYLLVGGTNIFLQFTLDTVISNHLYRLSSEFQSFQTETGESSWCQWPDSVVSSHVMSWRRPVTMSHSANMATSLGCTLTQEFSRDELG